MASYSKKQMGNYQLTRLLGEGAFAEVYLGEHIYLGTQAAIKVLKMQAADDPMNWFYVEARNIARLVHPNIVRVLDFGVEGTTPFLVLDYAPNGTLRQRHPNGTPLPLPLVVAYMKQVAEALQYAHDEKLVHRDVKPENILLGRRNEILLSDFGIALIMQTVQSQRVQDVAGTLPYMAPEQIQGQPRTASDQYSLGIIAYEWLTGYRPFNGSMTETIAQHLGVTPTPLREKIPSLHPAVEQVVLTALEKDYKRRFASVRAFAIALEQASKLAGTTTEMVERATVPVETPAHLLPPVTPMAKNIATPVRNEVSIMKSRAPGTLVSSYNGHQQGILSLSWSPDGTHIASTSGEKSLQVWNAQTTQTEKSIQDPSESARLVAWSADGLRIASVGSDEQVHVWEIATNSFRMTYAGHQGHKINALAWSPIQNVVATAGSNGTVHVWDAITGKLLTVYQGHRASVNTLAWTPNGPPAFHGHGYHIVSGGNDTTLQTWEAFTGRTIATYPGPPAQILSTAWSPGVYASFSSPGLNSQIYKSSRVACGRIDGMVQMWDTSTSQEVLSYRYATAISVVTWSPDGRRFAYAGEDTMVEVWDTTTNLKLLAFSNSAPVRAMAWSPDGTYIATGGDDSRVHLWLAP
ncbi:hypothetical protein KDA_56980 [Dictyobacter alpinus]|uniref:Protein kinase domain-containing protein n=1 Tax=Dictyobacter alpinus TaxID=2014873 RepID=A0A402BFS2_9CHLR|nr:serine/threonine-protein kinase [Dictyobacter alpinus]GCE30214.1 hypothetical protein KDA_56980 [Dictyobacter alpinus]